MVCRRNGGRCCRSCDIDRRSGDRVKVSFFVPGIPVPQGSMTGRVQGKRAVIYASNEKKLRPWREAVTRMARASWLDRTQLEGPVRLDAVFVFARPATVKRRLPSVFPDLDKLVRAVGDGVTEAGIWKDDGQVIRIVAEKVYGAAPGVHVSVSEMSADVPTRGERLLAGMGK
ncbi:RusA family crossover junction endodeoxyribonuclease [Microbacterium sp. YY-01]|uniref:RusA family crossover junction endodeoxyribonuclease n=1 Tax=Microbacterium sp. YY-01 TaxID=3421634 RepID=UPI003D165766